MRSNIRIVLVRPYHSGNIGSAARAMKTMGLSDLCVVNPVDFNTDAGRAEALKMAVSADDIVSNIASYPSLYEAVKDCTVVIASTARSRTFDLPSLTPEESAEKLYAAAHIHDQHVALVFGPERMGLSNDDLQCAKYRVTIPTGSAYSSLNLAAAVQLLAYELLKQELLHENKEIEEQGIHAPKQAINTTELPTTKSLQQFYEQLEKTLVSSGFIFKKHPGEIMLKIKVLLAKVELSKTDINILRGALASIQKWKHVQK